MSDVADPAELPFADLRVVEAGSDFATAYAGRLLCDLGAEVVKLEPADGDPARRLPPFVDGNDASAAAAYFHAGKNSVVIAADQPADDDDVIDRWLVGADIVLIDGDRRPGDRVAWRDLLTERAAADPALIVVDVSTYGTSGPFADDPPGDLMALADSGFLSVVSTAANDDDPIPLRVPGEFSSMLAGANAAIAAAAAMVGRDDHQSGDQIEVTRLETVASVLATAYGSVTYEGTVPVHNGTRAVIPWAVYQCVGGEVLIQCTEDSQWKLLVHLLGDPEWGQLDMFETTAQRVELAESVEQLVSAAMAEVDADEFLAAARDAGMPACRVHDASDVMAWEQLQAREFFQSITVAGSDGAGDDDVPVSIQSPTPPYRYDGQSLAGARRLGAVGERTIESRPARTPSTNATGDASGRRPLEGVRVLDLTWVWAGPFAAMQLAHLGAEVIKVESTTRPDVTRVLGPFVDGEPGLDRSAYFNQFNQGKRSVALDLSTDAGRAVLADLIRHADLIVDNMRAGALERMGFDDARLNELNPELVAVSLTGFGATGPERHRAAYGSLIDALAGVTSMAGRPGGGPTEIPMSLPDPGSGLHAALAMVAALRRRRRTGRSMRVDCSMVEAWISCVPWGVLTLAATGEAPVAVGNRDAAMSPHGVFRCDGDYEWVAIAARDDDEFIALARAIGRDDLADDVTLSDVSGRRANESLLEDAIEGWTRQRTVDEVVGKLRAVGVPARAVRRMDAVVGCPHLAARGFAPSLEHAEVGAVSLPGVAWHSRHWPSGPAGAAPALGADTDDVLRDIAGYDDARIAELRANEILS